MLFSHTISLSLYNKRCLFIRFSKKDVLIQHDYNDTEETGSGGISTLSEIDVSCYYYREVDESNDIDMSITVKYRSQFVIFNCCLVVDMDYVLLHVSADMSCLQYISTLYAQI